MPPKFVRRKIAARNNRKIADERIEILWSQVKANPKSVFAKKWIELAVKLASRWKTDLPRDMKGQYCASCYTYWVQGETCFYRTKNGKPLIICECGEEFSR